MLRVFHIIMFVLSLVLAGCSEHTPDRREALRPEEARRFPGLEVNPPDTYEYMELPPKLKVPPDVQPRAPLPGE